MTSLIQRLHSHNGKKNFKKFLTHAIFKEACPEGELYANKHIRIPRGVKEINKFMMFNEKTDFNYKFHYDLKNVIIANDVEIIGNNAFVNCFSLEGVIIPKSVRQINDYTFYGCYSLKNVLMSKGLEYIGFYAFNGCKKLKDIYIPESVEEIEEDAFKDCQFRTITIPKGFKDHMGVIFPSQHLSTVKEITYF